MSLSSSPNVDGSNANNALKRLRMEENEDFAGG